MADRDPITEALKDVTYPLVVIGSKSAAGEPNGMTATWAFQVSFEPRVFAVTIQEDAHTRHNIDATGVFSVSILPEGAHDLSLKFTRKSTSGEGRLEDEPVTYHETGAPVLDIATAWIECKVVSQTHPGDHVIFFGEVVGGGKQEGTPTTVGTEGMSYAG